MFDKLERKVIRYINYKKIISFVNLFEYLFTDFQLIIDLLNKEQPQKYKYSGNANLTSKDTDITKIVNLINMFFEDKYIYLSALSNQETQKEKKEKVDHIITLGKINRENTKKKTTEASDCEEKKVDLDIEDIHKIAKFYSKNLISTTKLQMLQQNKFHYEPTAQFRKGLKYQLLAIVATFILGSLTLSYNIYSNVTQQVTAIKITNEKAFENIIDNIRSENKNYKKYSHDIHSYLQEIKKLNVHNGNNRDNLIHILTENKEFLDKLIKEIKSTK